MCLGLFCLNKAKGFDTLNKIWTTTKRAGDPMRIQGFQDSSEKRTGHKAWMLGSREAGSSRDKIIRKQTLGPFLPTHWEKNLNNMFAITFCYTYFFGSRREAQHQVRFLQIVCVNVGIPDDVFSHQTKKNTPDNRR